MKARKIPEINLKKYKKTAKYKKKSLDKQKDQLW
jgi:hypothetical protein